MNRINIPLTPSLQKEIGPEVSDRRPAARNGRGFGAAADSLGSVLREKVGLPLACYLHDPMSPSSVQVVQRYFPSFSISGVVGASDHDEIFDKCFGSWLSGQPGADEEELTILLGEEIQAAMDPLAAKGDIWTAGKEHWVKERWARVRTGLLVRYQKARDQPRSSSNKPPEPPPWNKGRRPSW
jgi:hypothetical protein